MKRFISILCLMVGASVASYAGLITSTAGLTGSASLQNFDGFATGAFPLNSFLLGGVTVTVTSTSTVTSGDVSTKNTGGTASISTGAGGTSGNYISTFNVGQDSALSQNFARNLIFTFSAPVTGFLVDYLFNDSTLNYISLNGGAGTTLPTAGIGGAQIGYNNELISEVRFTFLGSDTSNGGDTVLFDNLRIVTNGTIEDGGDGDGDGDVDGDGGEPGEVPEPSTYALMGAGLLALACARRKK